MITIICDDGEKEVSVWNFALISRNLDVEGKFTTVSATGIYQTVDTEAMMNFDGTKEELRRLSKSTLPKSKTHLAVPADLINRVIKHINYLQCEDPTITITITIRGEELMDELKQLLEQ